MVIWIIWLSSKLNGLWRLDPESPVLWHQYAMGRVHVHGTTDRVLVDGRGSPWWWKFPSMCTSAMGVWKCAYGFGYGCVAMDMWLWRRDIYPPLSFDVLIEQGLVFESLSEHNRTEVLATPGGGAHNRDVDEHELHCCRQLLWPLVFAQKLVPHLNSTARKLIVFVRYASLLCSLANAQRHHRNIHKRSTNATTTSSPMSPRATCFRMWTNQNLWYLFRFSNCLNQPANIFHSVFLHCPR